MLASLQPNDTAIVVELSCIGRSSKDILEIVELIRNKGAHFHSLSEKWLDTITPQGQLIFTIFAGLCQFERDLIAERTKSGLAAAKARGRSGGRPVIEDEAAEAIRALHQNGMGATSIAKQIGVGRSMVYRVLGAQ
jgi:DNA invertase Pin-like site-specific DNA recombinase